MTNEEKKLCESLQKLEKADTPNPGYSALLTLVRTQRRKAEKARNFEFTLFILIAAFVAAASLLCFVKDLRIFLFLQAAPPLLLAGLSLSHRREER